jgi:gamma-glutamyl hydrolase
MTVIGIMTIPLSKNTNLKVNYKHLFKSYLPSGYVKWLEQSGAKVVPIPFNWSTRKINNALSQVNGVLFPGGSVDRDTHENFKKYVTCFKQIFNYAVSENNNGSTFPLWGTCLGFEFLNLMIYDIDTIVTNYVVGNKSLILNIVSGRHQNVKFNLKSNSKLPGKVKLIKNATIYMNHTYGILTDKKTMEILKPYIHVISTNKDKNNKKYISTIKYKKYPFWGTQWHPEKSAYEFNDSHIDHNIKNIEFSRNWSDFFVYECSKNKNKLTKQDLLIYHYSLYNPSDVKRLSKTGKVVDRHKSAFVESYYF